MNQTAYKIYTPFDQLTTIQKNELVDFLHEHLQEYRDSKPDIEKAISYAMKEIPSPGGFAIVHKNKKDIAGAVVVNKTGMSGYIPENILVYIAVHSDFRGQGLGKKLMNTAIKMSDGDVALHVESDNPARHLYEKVGFEKKYLEMRLQKDQPKKRRISSNTSTDRSPASMESAAESHKGAKN